MFDCLGGAGVGGGGGLLEFYLFVNVFFCLFLSFFLVFWFLLEREEGGREGVLSVSFIFCQAGQPASFTSLRDMQTCEEYPLLKFLSCTINRQLVNYMSLNTPNCWTCGYQVSLKFMANAATTHTERRLSRVVRSPEQDRSHRQQQSWSTQDWLSRTECLAHFLSCSLWRSQSPASSANPAQQSDVHTYTYTYTHTCIHMYTHTCTHTHTHTHTHTLFFFSFVFLLPFKKIPQ